MENKKQETLEEWKAGFEGLSFEQQAMRIRDKILQSPELDAVSKKYFRDTFEYVFSLYQQGRPLDTDLLRIHMTSIKSYKALTLQDFTKVMLMLSLCGFQFDFKKEN